MLPKFLYGSTLGQFMAEEQQCVFCHIASGKIPAKKVYEDDKVAAVLDINPAAPGHLLVIPKQHVAIMPQMSDTLVAHVGMISKQLSRALIRGLKIEGTSVFVANGVAAGQRAPHFLLHVIPRTPNDELGLQLPVVQLAESTMKEMFDKLAPAVATQFGIKPPKFKAAEPEEKKPEPEEPEKKEEPEEKKEPEEKEQEEEKEEENEADEDPKAKPGLDDIAEFLTGGK
jgi:histidine triad (HIT) family protein